MPTPNPTTAQAFDQLDEALKLDPDQRLDAERLHNEVTDLLREAGLISAAFLQGSFARKTMIAPLRDVDKVVILDPSLDGLHPDTIMDRIEAALRTAFPSATFDRTKHALQIDFGATSFYFDTVPARETSSEDDDIVIANRETGQWPRSNTRELIRTVAQRNADTNGRFIHQVRMAKQVIKHLLDGDIPGLHVESWAFLAITGPMPHDKALAATLATAAGCIGGSYSEPTGVDTISARLKPEQVVKARPVLQDAARRAAEAVDLASAGEHTEAIRIWHSLVGDCFPQPTEQDPETALRRSFHGGSITSAGTAAVTSVTRQTSTPTRSWRLM